MTGTREQKPDLKLLTNPLTNPAIAVELSMRERTALMDGADWEGQLERHLQWWEVQAPIGHYTPFGLLVEISR